MRYDRSKVLPPKFKMTMRTGSDNLDHYLIEDNGKTHASISEQGKEGKVSAAARANGHLAHLNKEHANGRVPHTVCEHGPCDWRRLTDPRTTPPEVLARVVLCGEHAARINAM